MKNRINIDGVWYVKEEEEKKNPVDLYYYYEAVYEDSNYYMKAHVFLDNNTLKVNPTSLRFEITDKRQNTWQEEYWDNIDWLRYLHLREGKQMREAEEAIGKDGLNIVLSMLDELKEKGWF